MVVNPIPDIDTADIPPMDEVKQEVLSKLRLADPYPPFKQHWDPVSPAFIHRVIEMLGRKPRIIVELGSWKGASTLMWAEEADATVIAVDTWLGSTEHYLHEPYKKDLANLYQDFLCFTYVCSHKIVPLRLSTISALQLLHQSGIVPDIIYFDAGHSTEEVYADLRAAYKCFPKAQLCGDDWSWGSVKEALKLICEQLILETWAEDTGNNWILYGKDS